MNISLTIPQIFYDIIARVFPGFLFLFALRTCLSGTVIDPITIITSQADTSLERAFDSLGFLVLCYFSGMFLRGLTWPNLRPHETSEFRTMLQRLRLQHPESGFRVIKLRAEAILFSSSRTGMIIVSGFAVFAWILGNKESSINDPIAISNWCIRIGVPVAVAIVFVSLEKRSWSHYHGNVCKLHTLVIKNGYPCDKIVPANENTEQITSAELGETTDIQS